VSVDSARITFNKRLKVEDFATLFGTVPSQIKSTCRGLIDQYDFAYRVLEGSERDDALLTVVDAIDTDTQIIGAQERKGVFQKGWGENLQAFKAGDNDLRTLIPKYIKPNPILRLNRQYIRPATKTFELDYYRVFRQWLFETYLDDIDTVYEFGCGTGWNLVHLAEIHPCLEMHGFDFVNSSRDLLEHIRESYGLNITGHLFDMLDPDEEISFKGKSAVLTFGAVEQLAGDIDPFLNFVLARAPNICITVEPTVEFYDRTNLLDYLAIKFHKKRGYTAGLWPRLKQLESDGVVEIIHVNRSYLGNMLADGYSLVVWRHTGN